MTLDLQKPEKMEAGRELDVKIAEIMGWTNIRFDAYIGWYGNSAGSQMSNAIPRFSTTGDGMLRMLEWANNNHVPIWFHVDMAGAFATAFLPPDKKYPSGSVQIFHAANVMEMPEAVARAIFAWKDEQEGSA